MQQTLQAKQRGAPRAAPSAPAPGPPAALRVFYLTDAPLHSRATYAIGCVRGSTALAELGARVTVAYPHYPGSRRADHQGDLYSYYGVKRLVDFVPLKVSTQRRARAGRLQRALTIGWAMARYLRQEVAAETEPYVIHSRGQIPALMAMLLIPRRGPGHRCRGIFLESHNDADSALQRFIASRVDGNVVNTQSMRDTFVRRLGIAPERVLAAPNGADLEHIETGRLPRGEARHLLGIPPGMAVVGYAGSVSQEKGLGIMLDCAQRFLGRNVLFLVVGKGPEPREVLEARARARGLHNVRFTGYVPPAAVATHLAAADVLLAPSTPLLPDADYCSPLKLFEYMAARRPIIASDLPVIREVATDGVDALLVPPSDVDGWCEAIERLLRDPALGEGLVQRAYQHISGWSWRDRAASIQKFLLQWSR